MHDGNPTHTDAPVDVSGNPPAGVGSADPPSVHLILGATRARLVISGEVDADLGPELQEAADAAEASGLPIEIDAHHVTFMDSSGVAFLARLASRSPHRVQVLRASSTVRFLLEVTKIGELLDVVDEDPGSDLDSPNGPDAR